MSWYCREKPNANHEYLCLVSTLTVTSHFFIPRMVIHSLAIARQLRRSEGLAGFALRLDWRHKTFWTVSAWNSEADLTRFIYANPHGNAMVTLRPLIERSKFVRRTLFGSELPVSWKFAESWIQVPGGF